jgi:hypothetical protein
MRSPSLLVAVTLWLSMSGCGGGSGPSGGTPVSAVDFPLKFAAAWCGLTKSCCEASGGTFDLMCEAGVVTGMTTQGMEAAADGAMWDAATAGRCLDGLGKADCAGTDVAKLVAMLDVCDDVWKGVVPPGGPCMTYSSCAEPSVSGGATAGASCVNSMCVPVVRQPVGSACSTATTMQCDPLAATCTGGACVALPGNGAACTGECRAGLKCTAGTCVALLAAGAACSADSDCASDRCSAGRCASVLAVSGDYCTLP